MGLGGFTRFKIGNLTCRLGSCCRVDIEHRRLLVAVDAEDDPINGKNANPEEKEFNHTSATEE